jgi:hypothetical protein
MQLDDDGMSCVSIPCMALDFCANDVTTASPPWTSKKVKHD